MRRETFYDIIANPEKVESAEVEEIVREYPFCEIGWMLYLKSLSETKSLRFENELRRGAIYVTNKDRLFYLINGDVFAETPVEPVATPSDYFSEVEMKEGDSKDPIDAFLLGERMKNTKKTAPATEENIAQLTEPEEHSPEILTETLARIYINQGQYERAKNIYKKLILRNPQKNTYFASQIEKIDKLLNNQ